MTKGLVLSQDKSLARPFARFESKGSQANVLPKGMHCKVTLPKTNIDPARGVLKDNYPFKGTLSTFDFELFAACGNPSKSQSPCMGLLSFSVPAEHIMNETRKGQRD